MISQRLHVLVVSSLYRDCYVGLRKACQVRSRQQRTKLTDFVCVCVRACVWSPYTSAGAHGGGPPIGHAARGHEMNEQYMKNFENAYTLLAAEGGRGVPMLGEGPVQSTGGGQGWAAGRGQQQRALVAGKGAMGEGGTEEWAELEGLETLAELSTFGSGVDDVRRWEVGPSNPKGTLIDLSDRPNMCISVFGNEAVIGSSDHALYAIDIRKRAKSRTLYTKTCGERLTQDFYLTHHLPHC